MRRVGLLIGGAALVSLLAALVWLLAFGNIRIRQAPEPEPDLPPAFRSEMESVNRDRLPSPGKGRLVVPVAGVALGDLTDTYSQARAGGVRKHDAIDIMAPAGTPVVAAAPGMVEKLFYSDRGGITAYIRSRDGRRIYYYAHLDRYAPGIVEGKRLEAGDAIGLVGATGNADPDAPHLHFAVMRMREGEGWWEGNAINPYPLLTGGH